MQPKVRLATTAYQKIMHWVHMTNFEVSGLGLVKYDKATHTYFVKEVYLLEQKNTSGDTEIEDSAYAALEMETKDIQSEENGWLNFWWHSHVNMGVFWSQTDMACINKFSQHGYWLATVFNKKAEMRSAIAIGEPVGAFQDNLPTEVDLGMTDEEIAALNQEYKDKVTNPVTVSHSNYYSAYRGGQNVQNNQNGASPSAASKSANSQNAYRSNEPDDELSLFEFMKRNKWLDDDTSKIMSRGEAAAGKEASAMDVSVQIEKDIALAAANSITRFSGNPPGSKFDGPNGAPRIVRRVITDGHHE
jgi:proteasome lid subunit RPN8/RPN11